MTEWTKRPTDADWDALVNRSRQAKSVLCIAHIAPDGDALGSALGVAIALDSLGVNARVSFDEEPFRVPSSLAWLPRQDLVVGPREIDEVPEVAISFDASDIQRLGGLAEVAGKAGLFAAIDHHRSHTGFAELAIVQVDSPATAVLAAEFVDRLGAELTKDVATCLYAGLTTDTGSFRFAGTTAATHELAARFHQAGIEHDVIARSVFDTHSLQALKLLGLALERITLVPSAAHGDGLVWTWVSKADRDKLDLPLDEVESIIDTIRTVDQSEVAVVVKEGDDEVWRVSTRSKGRVDLGEVCSALGGGGHRFAAGFSSTDEPSKIIDAIVSQIG